MGCETKLRTVSHNLIIQNNLCNQIIAYVKSITKVLTVRKSTQIIG